MRFFDTLFIESSPLRTDHPQKPREVNCCLSYFRWITQSVVIPFRTRVAHAFQGDKRVYQASVRDRLSKRAQTPDVEDSDFIDEGRALLIEAKALGVTHAERELVETGVKSLSPQWRALKRERLLRPPSVTTFDELEQGLQDKVSLKEAATDPTLRLEQNMTQGKGGKRKGGKKKPLIVITSFVGKLQTYYNSHCCQQQLL